MYRERPAETDQAVESSRPPNRPAGVFRDTDGGKIGRDAGSRSARRTGWAACRVVRISSDPEGRTNVTGSKLAHICFRKNDRSSFFHLRRDRGISPRSEFLEDHGPIRRRHVAGFDLVL